MADDTLPPAPPTLSVSKNAAGYVLGNAPFIAGIAEPGATVQVFSGGNIIGTALANADGFWNATSVPLGDGLGYVISARAADAAGNQSAPGANLAFNVDTTAPEAPQGDLFTNGAGLLPGNQGIFSGRAEAGTAINLIDQGAGIIGRATAGADGAWSITTAPVPDGYYDVRVQSVDLAYNASVSAVGLAFRVSSELNQTGTPGNDLLLGNAGNNALAGLDGIDTALYAGARADHAVARTANGVTVSGAASGTDSLTGVERIRFADGALAIDIDGHGGQSYRLYKAAFDRAPDPAGVGYWMAQLDQGMSVGALADAFLSSPEFAALYGASPATADFVDRLYHNVLHRPGDQGGVNFWVTAIDAGQMARAEVLAAFSESPENQAQVIGSIQAGFEYTPYG